MLLILFCLGTTARSAHNLRLVLSVLGGHSWQYSPRSPTFCAAGNGAWGREPCSVQTGRPGRSIALSASVEGLTLWSRSLPGLTLALGVVAPWPAHLSGPCPGACGAALKPGRGVARACVLPGAGVALGSVSEPVARCGTALPLARRRLEPRGVSWAWQYSFPGLSGDFLEKFETPGVSF